MAAIKNGEIVVFFPGPKQRNVVVGWLDSYTVLTIDRIGSILFLKIS